MMIRFKNNIDRGVSVVDGGKVYVFNSSGIFDHEEEPNGKNIQSLQNMPIISIITSNGNTDVMAHFTNDTEKYFNSSMTGMACASKLSMGGDFVRMLRRDGKEDGTSYNQILFIYRVDVNLNNKLALLELEERNNVSNI